jgi:hypothetical protein
MESVAKPAVAVVREMYALMHIVTVHQRNVTRERCSLLLQTAVSKS